MIGKTEILICLAFLAFSCCQQRPALDKEILNPDPPEISVGAERLELYLSKLEGKSVGMLVNQSSLVSGTHLVDTLVSRGVNVKRIFSPEHGFRGTADRGEKIKDDVDSSTGVPIVSLYGSSKKPTMEQLEGLDILVFDLQEVGVRFYTYTSSLHYFLEAAAEADIPVIILDRPNPNGRHLGGNVHSLEKTSFVGLHPVPILHGMTIGEYGRMIVGEGWLADAIRANLEVIPCGNYTRDLRYELPIRPSPNLPNLRSILLYPSLCLFEGTVVSVGRGTAHPFQVYGHPEIQEESFQFTPRSSVGAKYPVLENESCKGWDLRAIPLEELEQEGFTLKYLMSAYQAFPDKTSFFLETGFFDTLFGNSSLRKMIQEGRSESEIMKSFEEELSSFEELRKKYLIYN
ncbi:MAG: DUF1343 domain-containing protein [Saprospiraceae bacterium]|nr:DUF1343 domain-containing protein [Saprospiraceae bacterium]